MVGAADCKRAASPQRKCDLELPQFVVQAFHGRLGGCSCSFRLGRVHLSFCFRRPNARPAQAPAPAHLMHTIMTLDFSHQLLELLTTQTISCTCAPAAHHRL
eukprot:scaffold13751_cov108-Isochrysis_galbana.AAC.9